MIINFKCPVRYHRPCYDIFAGFMNRHLNYFIPMHFCAKGQEFQIQYFNMKYSRKDERSDFVVHVISDSCTMSAYHLWTSAAKAIFVILKM